MASTSPIDAARDSLYVIPATDPEKKRLVTQYAFKKALYGWTGAVPSSVDVSKVSDVLDVAAGTLVWTIDFANMPEAKSRLGKSALDDTLTPPSPPIHLHACDIETKFFPDQTLIDAVGVSTFQHDVTKPFPPELRGKFDLIQVSFLLLCLTEEGWTSALTNLRQALKPGGLLMLNEADPIMYSSDFPPPPEGSPHDLTAVLNAPGWLGKANRIYTAFSLEHAFLPDLTYRLPTMLSSAGFEVVDTARGAAPCGKLCRSLYDGKLSDFEDFSVENLAFIFEYLAGALLEKGKLEDTPGVKITTKQEMSAMVDEIKQGFRKDGALSLGRYCVARKQGD